jgi:hypothetical protein
MAESLFGLSGEDYWREPWKGSPQMHETFVLGGKFGLYIDAPSAVNSALHESIPVPFFYVAQYREAYKVDLDTMAKLVAIRLEDRAFFIENALTPEYNSVPEGKVGKDSTDPTSFKKIIDPHVQLGLLYKPGKYRLIVLLQQQASNVVEVKVEQRRVQHPDPEAQKFIDGFKLPEPPPPPPPPPSAMLRWKRRVEGVEPLTLQPMDGGPAIPDKPGIDMKVDRVILTTAGASSYLKGSFRLPVFKRDLVPQRPPNTDPMVPFMPEYGMPRPTAMLPITLVILGSEYAAEIVIPLSVPTFDAIDPALEENVGTGYFAIDLLSNLNIRNTAQIFSIYAFCGEFMKGPAVTATVTPDMLPKPIA